MEKIKICLVGASGKMGRVLIETIQASKNFCLSGAIVSANNPQRGDPIFHNCALVFSNNLNKYVELSDLILDFSSAKSTFDIVRTAIFFKKPLICGVTGLNQDVQKMMKEEASQFIPIFYAPNMSLGIAIMNKAVALLAQSLKDDFDIEIQEIHHSQKIDNPSGTALFLGQTIADALEWKTSEVFCFNRCETKELRPRKQIGFSSMRGGSVNGIHTVYFLGQQESISITHESTSRSIFALGALKIARWLYDQKKGFYSMKNFIEDYK